MAKEYVPYSGPLVTRAEAKAKGLKRFFTGVPCKHGHLLQRQTGDNACVACRLATTLRYQAANPEKLAEYQLANAEVRRARSSAWQKANPEKARAKTQRYRDAHPEESGRWAKQNPEGARAIKHRRRAKERAAEGTHTAADIQRIGATQRWRCHWCGVPTKKGYHVDHIKPLSRGGSNWPSNLCISCGPCNVKKAFSDPIAFAQRMGRLL